MNANRLIEFTHISVSRRGRIAGPLDDALAALGKRRKVSTIVPTFNAALLTVCSSDLIAAMPSRLAVLAEKILPVRRFSVPVRLPQVSISLAWHPRLQNDPLHRWIRQRLQLISEDWGRDAKQKRRSQRP